jgi:Ni/Fe-hydrogenase subunit HybB-like protein
MSGESNTANKSLVTPFNIVTGIILIVGFGITALRFTKGLGATTNLTNNTPWGIWIGFDLLVGVALAAGGYVTSAAVYIFGMKRYHSAVRPAVLTGFLGYLFVVIALHYDLGRPWRLPYPFIVGWGTTSLLFEVGLCVALYLTVLFLEFTPAPLEWLGFKKTRALAVKLTMVLTIFGVVLSTLHQSSLGALFLIAPSKLHPLWYTPYLPVFFFVSSVIAGLSMVMFEGSLAHRAFHHKMDAAHLAESDPLTLGFGKAAALALAGYFTIKWVGVAAGNNWHLLATKYGAWFLVEMFGFVALPCLLYAIGVREKKLKLIRFTAGWTVLGIILNRLNVSVIAFNYHLPSSERYVPHWMEIAISIFLLTLLVTCYRFIVSKMPVLYEHPEYKENH